MRRIAEENVFYGFNLHSKFIFKMDFVIEKLSHLKKLYVSPISSLVSSAHVLSDRIFLNSIELQLDCSLNDAQAVLRDGLLHVPVLQGQFNPIFNHLILILTFFVFALFDFECRLSR